MPGDGGNSNFYFLRGSGFQDNAAVGAAQDTKMGNPIVQL